MAITKVTGHVIDPITNITSHNINSSGIITATRFDGPIGAGLTDGNFSGIITATQLNVTGVGTFNGIGVTSLNVSGVSTFSGNIFGTGDVTITDTTADSAAGPEFKLYRNSASPADADYLGQIKFAGESDTGVERNYAKITGKILDASNGTEDGIIEIAHIKAGSQTITGRWRSDSLQLLNGTSLTVAGTADVTGNMTVGGNLNVSGVLTYEDVTNIDSLGIVTARTGIKVLAGELTVGNNIKLGNAGVVTATSFIGDGSGLTGIAGTEHVRTASLTVSGVSTFTGMINSHVHIADAVASNDYASLYLGTGNDVRFFHNGQNTFWQHKLGTPNNGGNLYIDSYSSLYLRTSDGSNNVENAIRLNGNDSVEIYHSGNKKLETTSTGAVVTGILTATSFSGSIAASGEIEASQDYPSVRPLINWNFAATKKLDSRITYQRTGPASYTDEFGKVVLVGDNVPRFDHDPLTGECKGLLIEPSRTNLFSGSADMASSNSRWATGGSRGAQGANVKAPDGRMTAYQNVYNGTNGDLNIYYSPVGGASELTTTNDTTYTMSVWAKLSAGASYLTGCRLRTYNQNISVNYDLNNGAVFGTQENQNSDFVSSSIEEYPDGWYRCIMTFKSGTDGNQGFQIYLISGTNNHTLNSSSANGESVSFWGVQLEAGSYATSYIPTSADVDANASYRSPAPRGGDFAYLDGTTGTEFDDIYDPEQGTFVINWFNNPSGNHNDGYVFAVDDGSGNNRIAAVNSNGYQVTVTSGGSSQGTRDLGSINSGDNKIAFTYKLNDQATSLNGSDASVDTTCTIPTTTLKYWWFGCRQGQYDLLGGYISNFSYYPRRLTNAQLKNLSS